MKATMANRACRDAVLPPRGSAARAAYPLRSVELEPTPRDAAACRARVASIVIS
jgi:hypothetical protein